MASERKRERSASSSVARSISRWSEELSESVLGNVGTLIAFRCGLDDARRLAPVLRPFTAEQLMELDRLEAVVRMQVDGQTLPAFDLKILPIEATPDEASGERIRSQTRQQFGRPREEVERSFGLQPPADDHPGAFDVDEE